MSMKKEFYNTIKMKTVRWPIELKYFHLTRINNNTINSEALKPNIKPHQNTIVIIYFILSVRSLKKWHEKFKFYNAVTKYFDLLCYWVQTNRIFTLFNFIKRNQGFL